jgi:hypothetical protein
VIAFMAHKGLIDQAEFDAWDKENQAKIAAAKEAAKAEAEEAVNGDSDGEVCGDSDQEATEV